MKIGIFGTGVVGQTHAERLTELGKEVMIGTRNVQESLTRHQPDNFKRPGFGEWHKKNNKVRLGTYFETAAFGEIIILATNGSGTIPALQLAGKEGLSGKVIIDISNPLDFSKGFPPSLFVCNTDSLGEQIQREFPETLVVKCLNTMNAFVQVNPAVVPGDHSVFLGGNDAGAKLKTRAFLHVYGWNDKNIIDVGDITASRGLEQILPLWVRLMSVFKTPMFNFHVAGAPTQTI
jgi:predicted dinucleotide-binding enzyme